MGSLEYYPSELTQYYENLTAIEHEMTGNVPRIFDLKQNYPNPFNPTTTVEFTLAKSGLTSMIIYNALGQKMKTIIDNDLKSGPHKLVIDMSEHSSGIYYYVLKQRNNRQIHKMVLIK